jgi:hypothetical protein
VAPFDGRRWPRRPSPHQVLIGDDAEIDYETCMSRLQQISHHVMYYGIFFEEI